MCVCVGGGGGHSNCNASLSQSPFEGGGGLKLEKINAGITIKSTPSSPPKKKMGIGSPVFCTFAFTPNQITAA